jgi:hypothetical protein
MLSCPKCRYFIKDYSANANCAEGMRLTAQVVKACDTLMKVKRQAVSTINEYVYACPDVAVHGEAFALTAQPMAVAGIQDELF